MLIIFSPLLNFLDPSHPTSCYILKKKKKVREENTKNNVNRRTQKKTNKTKTKQKACAYIHTQNK